MFGISSHPISRRRRLRNKNGRTLFIWSLYPQEGRKPSLFRLSFDKLFSKTRTVRNLEALARQSFNGSATNDEELFNYHIFTASETKLDMEKWSPLERAIFSNTPSSSSAVIEWTIYLKISALIAFPSEMDFCFAASIDRLA